METSHRVPSRNPEISNARKSLADRAYEQLRRRIETLQMAPGMWFKEREIAVELGFTAMPLREAIDRLERDGLVRTVARRGSQVTPLSAKYVRDFFDIWKPLALTVCRMACTRATEDQAIEITRAVMEMQVLIEHSEIDPRIIDKSAHVFELMVAAADNEHFNAIWRRLSGTNHRIFTAAYAKDPGITRTVYVLRRTLDAWRTRDVETLIEISEEYVTSVRASILRLL